MTFKNRKKTLYTNIQEQKKPEMTGYGWSNKSYVASQTCPQCKGKMLKATNIESLPEDIITEILVRVPAQDIHDSTRLVCRKWYKLFQTRNFIHSHLQRSTPGLHGVCVRTFMTMQNGQIEISKLSYGFKGTFLYSCNGLVLVRHKNSEELYITNPVTEQHFALPSFFSTTHDGFRFVIAYAASSRAYKVLRIFNSDDGNLGCAIMTVGVDTNWERRVSTQHLSLTARELLKEFPMTTQGFVHWARDSYSECVLTMNVESEIITQIPGPCLCHDDKSLCYCYIPMGSYLSLLIVRDESLEVWKMKPETGEWTKMPNIDLEPREVSKHLSFKFKRLGSSKWCLRPVGWSNSEEVLFFRVCSSISHIRSPFFVACNVRTREMDSCELELDNAPTSFVDHRSSLVWLD